MVTTVAVLMLWLAPVHAASQSASFCELEFGDHGVLPLLHLPDRLADVDEIDALFEHVEWAPLVGRDIRVHQRRSKSTYVSSTQRFLGRDALLREYPEVAQSIADLDRAHDERRGAYDRGALAKILRVLRPFSRRAKAFDHFYPGEFVSVALSLPTGSWTSDLKAGFDQFRSLRSKLFRFNAAPLVSAMKSEIIAYADGLDGETRPRLRVYLVHNHPGRRPQPLSRQDLKVQRTIAEMLSWWTDTFDFEVTMIALTDLHGQRDAAFVRTIDQSDYEDVRTPSGRGARTRSPVRRRR